MSTAGLALVGFMASPSALNFLRNSCVPYVGASDADLQAEWEAAATRLGPAIPSAGHPDIMDIPEDCRDYISRLTQEEWVAQALQGQTVSFGLVEIDPLLAYQFHVDLERSSYHCAATGRTPTVSEMLPVCLPTEIQMNDVQVQQQQQSVIIRSRNLAFGARAQGILTPNHAGMYFNLALPLLHVVRFNGRCYLHNGFHRAYGLRQAGASHVPCLIRDVSDAASAGVREDGGTFPLALLESDNPPTVGHFTQGRAHAVRLRQAARILHVSWAEYVMPEE